MKATTKGRPSDLAKWTDEQWEQAIAESPRPIFMEFTRSWVPEGVPGDYLAWLADELLECADDYRRLQLLDELRNYANDELTKHIAWVRGDGSDDYLYEPMPWSSIGRALGTTGEAARQKYGDDGRKDRLEEALRRGERPAVVRPGPGRKAAT
ncbi:MAG TPA: hypothetical protein VGW38_09620 [Chloroflexota bacterium]|nr:hypothetical protein [Chloroflexota bacterium]